MQRPGPAPSVTSEGSKCLTQTGSRSLLDSVLRIGHCDNYSGVQLAATGYVGRMYVGDRLVNRCDIISNESRLDSLPVRLRRDVYESPTSPQKTASQA